MKRILFLVFFLFCKNVYSQQPSKFRQYLGGFVMDTADVSRPQALVYPTIGYSPETNIEIGLSGLYLFYANQDTANRLSEVVARMFYTLENQYGAFVEHALYSDQNNWFLLGELRYQSFPLPFFGVGINTDLSDEQRVAATQFVVKERILKKIKNNFYGGLELEYNRTDNVRFGNPAAIHDTSGIKGENGSANLGIGFGLVLDTPHNVLNVRNGYFSELAYLKSSRALGSDFGFGTLISDTRYFKSVRKDQVLAVQLLGQFSWGDVPFNQLSQLGGPNLLRGYYLGRFRDKNMLAAQLEYRFLPIPLGFTNRIGAVVFASSGTVYNQYSELTLDNFKSAVGAGFRFLLFPKKDIYVRMDYELTREGNGFYIYIGEAF
jgi:hypothetical protein